MTIMGQNSAAAGPVIMMELNELCPPIIEKMMAAGELPNFKRLHAKSDVHVTWTDDPDLEPWVQWVTLHTGQTQDIHGAKELDEGHGIKLPRVWDMLGERGAASLVFGSMNSAALPSDRVFLVPDPWSTHIEPSDAAWKPFHDFISFNVTEHANKCARPDRKATRAFLRFLVSHGLSIGTLAKAVRQLASERIRGAEWKWGRAVILDLLMWDVFEKEYRKRRPDFATFFANSTAYLQHRYWRHMEPEAYQVKPPAEEMAAFGDAIQTSYRHMDWLLGRAMRLVGPKGRIVFATGLSQEANLRYENIGGKFVYRPHSFERLNAFMGGPKATFEPVMTHQAWASFENAPDADRFEEALARLQSDGASVFEWRRSQNRILFWCRFISKVDGDLILTNTETGVRKDFVELFGSLGQVNNSQHNRNGCFWVERADGKGVVHAAKLPLERVLPLLLDMFSQATRAKKPSKRAA